VFPARYRVYLCVPYGSHNKHCQLDQGFPWFSLVPERMLSWYPNSTLHCMLLMQPSKYQLFKIFRHNLALPKSDYISPTTAAPTSFKSKLNKSFTRRTSGHCLGTFQTAKLCLDYAPLQNGSVSHYPSPQLSSLSLSLRIQ
jgi:hypothetical protein